MGSVPFFITKPPMRFVRNTFPTATDIIPLSTAKAHLRVEHSDEDALITTLISVAQDAVENYTGTFLQTTTGHFFFDYFEEFMNLSGGTVHDHQHGS